MRKKIYIEPAQEILLKRLASESGVSEAELVRQAIERLLEAHYPARADLQAWEAERDFIARRMARGPIAGARAWRRDDLYS